MPQEKQIAVSSIVWLDYQERIASFHCVDGYDQREFPIREHFIGFLQTLTCSGYRFM